LSFARTQTITILIDPGHGGSDPGHESSNPNHLKEKDLNLIIAKKVGAYLNEKLGHVNILYTRTEDTYPTLDQRVAQANSQRVDLFLSIHCNASGNSNTHGTETHVHDMSAVKSVKLATKIEEEFKGKAGRKSRGVKDTDDREYSLQVLKYTNDWCFGRMWLFDKHKRSELSQHTFWSRCSCFSDIPWRKKLFD
jgi:N-acetylmuramoyl-L-alanine amidase